MKLTTCAICGDEFMANPRGKYCSVACRKRGYYGAVLRLLERKRRARPLKPCAHCGKPFARSRDARRYCSSGCRLGAAKFRQQLKRRGRVTIVECVVCGTETAGAAQKKFCDRCRRQRALDTAQNYANNNQDKIRDAAQERAAAWRCALAFFPDEEWPTWKGGRKAYGQQVRYLTKLWREYERQLAVAVADQTQTGKTKSNGKGKNRRERKGGHQTARTTPRHVKATRRSASRGTA